MMQQPRVKHESSDGLPGRALQPALLRRGQWLLAGCALAAAGGLLIGCVTRLPGASAELNGYSFSYTVPDRELTGLIQVFDDGHRTYLQFADWSQVPFIADSAGNSLAYERNGAFAMLDGKYSKIRVTVAERQSLVIAAGEGAQRTVAIEAPAKADVSTVVMEKNAEVTSLKTRVATLESELAAAKATLLAYADQLVIHFPNNSSRITVDQTMLDAIAEVVRDRERIVVSGYTDANHPSEAGENLAKHRATNVRALLIAEGIPSVRIRVTYSAAGHFAADNQSPDGKALNRRVEIVPKENGQPTT